MAKLLVIDDDQVILDSIARQLSNESLEVDFECDPVSALDRFRDQHYDLVLCDIQMRPINGVEVLRRIRGMRADIPVLIVSAFVDDQLYEETRDLGCTAVLLKPVPKKNLISAIYSALT